MCDVGSVEKDLRRLRWARGSGDSDVSREDDVSIRTWYILTRMCCRSSRYWGNAMGGCEGIYRASTWRYMSVLKVETLTLDIPVRQFELMRNIHFQSRIESSELWWVRVLPGNGLTSLPSARPKNPLTPLSLAFPYSPRYKDFQSYLNEVPSQCLSCLVTYYC